MSICWLDKFKNRHGIRNLSIQGEKLSAAEETVNPFLQKLHRVVGERVSHLKNSTMLTRLDFCGDVYRKELLFPVTKNLLQDSREQRTCYFLRLHYCLINIHIFDYPDSQLSGLFTQVQMSPDNQGPTVPLTATFTATPKPAGIWPYNEWRWPATQCLNTEKRTATQGYLEYLTGLCSSSAQEPQLCNFCSWVTKPTGTFYIKFKCWVPQISWLGSL